MAQTRCVALLISLDRASNHFAERAKSSTFEWLDKAYEDHSTWLTFIKVDPRFDTVRDDPRYHGLLRQMRLPE
jgi:hypothetical protein